MSKQVNLVIIDQLRADYLKYLPRLASKLPQHHICDADALPTSTEAMHATISTGTYPATHGCISKNTLEGSVGIKQLRNKFYENLSPLGDIASEANIEFRVFGGKPETIDVMGRDEDFSVVVRQDIENKNKLVAFGTNKELEIIMQEITNKIKIENNRDIHLIESFDYLLQNEITNGLNIILLPDNDTIGHKHGPHSKEVVEHLNLIDNYIAPLIKESHPTIVMGDHGCRITSSYVIELPDLNSQKNKLATTRVYRTEGQKHHLIESYQFLSEEIKHMEFDGGILRLWYKENKNISSKTIEFLNKYGCLLSNDIPDKDSSLQTIYNHSKHPNLGDMVVVANKNVTFCKYKWVPNNAQRLLRGKSLVMYNWHLPIGEHGSHHIEDRYVGFLSNINNLPKNLRHKDIRTILKNQL